MKKAGWSGWWWTIVFCLAVGSTYAHFAQQKKCLAADLRAKLSEMEQERLDALEERESLCLQIASQSDPSWIEMVLMRDLGVVPEGWLKVHFSKKE